MRSIKPDGLMPMVRAQSIGLPGRACLSISAMWRLSDGKLAGDGEMWNTISEEGAGLFDLGLPKPRGEVLVEGAACAQQPTTGVRVRLCFAEIDKLLYVVGDRQWRHGEMSEPTPFTQKPVSWPNAFGGEKDSRNPLGKGKKATVEEDGKKVHWLPNVECPQRLVQSPRDSPPPAGYGPLDVMWEPRVRRRGTYDQRWLKTRFPELPDDFDGLFHNIAPEDQWLKAFVRGDEIFRIENMHPELPVLEGVLPGLLARAFVRLRSQPEAIDVPMHCDTVWFYPTAGCIGLVWRGVFDIDTDDETEVTEALVALERLGAPRDEMYYENVRAKRLDKDLGAMHALRDADLLPAGVRIAKARGDSDLEPALDREWALNDMLRRRAAHELENSRQHMASLGFDPDETHPKELPSAEEFDTDDLATLMETLGERFKQVQEEANEHKAQAREGLEKACADAGLDVDELIEQRRVEGLGPPKYDAARELATLRSFGGLAEKTAIVVPANVQQQLDDPQLEEKFYAIEAAMLQAYRMSVHYQSPVPPLGAEDAAEQRVRVEAAITAGLSLVGQDLTGAHLSGVDFSGQDLTDVLMESANLDGCCFDDACLERAVLAHAFARKATFRNCKMKAANLGRAELSGASFVGSDLTQTTFIHATLDGADLSDTVLTGADLSEATLVGASLCRCRAKDMTLSKVCLSEARLQGVDLQFCNFLEVDCSGADFSGAKLDSSVFLDSCGDGSCFRGASLVNLRVVSGAGTSSFTGTDFRQCDLSTAFLRGAKLANCDFRGAQLNSADFSDADLSDAKFDSAQAVGARFERAILTDASFVAVDLMNALLARAKVAGANFHHANLFRADGMKMVGDKRTKFTGANLEQFRFVAEQEKNEPAGS